MLRPGLAGMLVLLVLIGTFGAIEGWEAIQLAERIALMTFALFLYTVFFLNPSKERAWLLFPAGLAIVLAPILHWLDLKGWTEIAWLWPAFLFGPFLGFFQWYLFGKRQHTLFCLTMLFLLPAAGLTGYNLTAAHPLHASVWWPIFPFLFSLTLHIATYKKQTWANRLTLASAGILLTCSLIFFSHTLLEIPYSILWSFFLLTPLVGIGEIYFFRSQRVE